MMDYEDLILQRQELLELWEDGCIDDEEMPVNWWDDLDPDLFESYR